MKQILSILLITLSVSATAQKHSRKNDSGTEQQQNSDSVYVIEQGPDLIAEPIPVSSDKDPCLWPISGYSIIRCRNEAILVSGSRMNRISEGLDNPEIEKQEEIRNVISQSMGHNGIVSSRKDFKSLRKYLDLEVDWNNEMVTFYTVSTTYQHGDLYTVSSLMGISISPDGKTLDLGFRSTFHGVCQGVAMQMEWFSSESTTYAIVIPNTVEKITRSWCHDGPDCGEIP